MSHSATKVRPIAIYLPQFYPIPENDNCWGKGFTEWTNVTKAQPLFKDHYQPHLPADLGFYDLRVPEVRQEQVDLARQHGIHGFCYYHYWFNGHRVLERPFNEVIASGKPDFPFMLCWANENWARVWDGGDQTIMCKQEYSEEDHVAHVRSLIPVFKDPRYIKIQGKAVFAIYRSTNIPDVQRALKIWRNEAEKEGVKLYICRFESYSEGGMEYMKDGFDAAVRFEPFSTRISPFQRYVLNKTMANKFSPWYIRYKLSSTTGRRKMFSLRRLDYGKYVDFLKSYKEQNGDYKLFPGVTPMWDNSPRKKIDYFMFTDSTPGKFQEWMENEIENFIPFSSEENFLFINAWNEWAEGNHLEPCQKWGRDYLEAVKNALNK